MTRRPATAGSTGAAVRGPVGRPPAQRRTTGPGPQRHADQVQLELDVDVAGADALGPASDLGTEPSTDLGTELTVDAGPDAGTGPAGLRVAERRSQRRTVAEVRLTQIAALLPDDPERVRLRRLVVEEQLPLVHHLARRFRGRGEPYDDLVQVGTIGLLHAVDRYDASRGGSFTTFAVPTILGEIRKHFRDRGWAMRVPRRMQDLARQVSDARELLTHRLDRSPTAQEIAQQLRLEVDLVLEALETAGAYATVPLPATEDDAELGFFGAVDEALEHVENREALRPLLQRLSARERRILALRFGRGLSQSQIATEIGVSQMHVSRLLTRSLSTLRSGFTDES